MGIVYHGSKKHGLKRLEPRQSTHGTYVYATPEKALALIFSSRCGDDLTYDVDHFDTDINGPYELVELIPNAFDKMFCNSSSIYSLSDETFKDIHTEFAEVVSEVGVDVLKEEYCKNVYKELLKLKDDGLLIIYRYPNKPKSMKIEYVLDKYRLYKNNLNMEFSKNDFDRLVCLHPELLNEINILAKEFNYDYFYEPKDLINLFKERIDRQLKYPDKEQYIESSYINICNTYPDLKDELDKYYNC